MAAKIKFLFAAVILTQPLQYMFIAKYGEPYPALTMPNFTGNKTDRNGNISFTNVICKVNLSNGRVRWLTEHDLLPQVPSSHQYPIMSHMFGVPSDATDSWPPNSLKARLFRGEALSRARSAQKELDPQTKDWLKRKLHELYPSQEPEMITFIWYQDVFNANQVSPSVVEDVSGVREVRF